MLYDTAKLIYLNDRTHGIIKYNEYVKVKCYINLGFQSDEVDGINIETMNYEILFSGGYHGEGYK